MSQEFPQVWKNEGDPNYVEVVWKSQTDVFKKVDHVGGEDHILDEDFLLQGDAQKIAEGKRIYAATEDRELSTGAKVSGSDRSEHAATPKVIYNDFRNQPNLLTIVYKDYTEDYRLQETHRNSGHMLNEIEDLESYYRGNGFHRVGTTRHMSPSRFMD